MTTPQNVRSFKINPVEVAIFSVISLVFLNSVYNLFSDRQGFHVAILDRPASTKTDASATDTKIQAVTAQVESLDVKCDSGAEMATKATKVRLAGQVCDATPTGRAPASDASKLIKTQVTNNSNQFVATVFTDSGTTGFSTDYIPLNTGKNPIHVEFLYQGGKSVVQDFIINRD